ncbi:MAG TPA: sulfotransferase [Acidimicrobiales bacterium]|nr:sulfotransferase [Acidimicrobiales bacterium]
MTLPSFLVIGAARSATTSLHYYLDQHPSITMSSIKEPNFFAFDHTVDPPAPLFDPTSSMVTKSVTSREAYEGLFAHARPGDVLGEASPLYLYVRETPEQVERLLGGDVRFIAVLRNPIDRAYSHWLHIRRGAAEDAVAGFRAACEREMAGGRDYTPYASGTHVLRMGLYDVQLDRYTARFGRPSLLVLDYDALTDRPQRALDEVCDHLGVERHAFQTSVQYNRSGVTKGRTGAALAKALQAAQPRVKAIVGPRLARRLGRLRAAMDTPQPAPAVPPDLRRQLAEWFQPSVDRLVELGHLESGRWSDFT